MNSSTAQRILRSAGVVGLILGSLALPAAATAGRSYSTQGAWHFYSAAKLHPPKLEVLTRRRSAPHRGYFLTDTLPSLGQGRALTGEQGVMLLDSALRPAWVHGAGPDGAATDLQEETYRGHRVLVWWQGRLTRGGAATGRLPSLKMVDERYRTVATLTAASPWLLDAHDAEIDGTDAWVAVLRVVDHQDLAPYGGAMNASLYDYGVQEYDLRTGRLLYTWDPLNPGGKPHVPLSQSNQPPPAPGATGLAAIWDPYHLNSIELEPHHRLLVSMRNTWGIYLIDRASGQPVWTLGGKHSSFPLEGRTRFAWQHDARTVASVGAAGGQAVELTLFNDNCCADGSLAGRPSKGMILRLNPVTHRAGLVVAYRHSPPLVVPGFGSLQPLPAGRVLIDWGGAYLSEYTRSGRKLLDVRWPGVDRSYRALYTDGWAGTPYYPPAGAVRQVHGRTIVYASWNGATQVARWEVRAGNNTSSLRRVGGRARTGFETKIALRRRYRVYEVRAVNAHGSVLRTSAPFR